MRKRCRSSAVTALSLIVHLDTFDMTPLTFDDAVPANPDLLVVVFILSFFILCKVTTYSPLSQTFALKFFDFLFMEHLNLRNI